MRTRLTEMFNLVHPIVLAPMGGVSGGRLAAAVSNAGGLGLVGGGYCDPPWLQRELRIAASLSRANWGVGLITWCITPAIMKRVLRCHPAAILLSFGDPRPWSGVVKKSGARLICQVQDLAGARLALEAGADVIVAQGTEADGHGASRATFPLVPAVADLAGPVATLAAGGIADGRGLAAALMLGADGALIGTRFYAATEALANDAAKLKLVTANGDSTTRTRVFDIVRDLNWPAPYTGRALVNQFTQKWEGLDGLLRSDQQEAPRFKHAQARADFDTAMVWAGECVDLIDSVETAKAIVLSIARGAEQRIAEVHRVLRKAQVDASTDWPIKSAGA